MISRNFVEINEKITVWGAGCNNTSIPQNLDIRAVRGPKTNEILKRRGFSKNVSQLDPAYLLSDFSEETFEKYFETSSVVSDYTLIIPHIFDSYHWGTLVKSKVKNSTITSSTDSKVIDYIRKASLVISSSLHGLILADAYGKNFVALKPQNEPTFKYYDWPVS